MPSTSSRRGRLAARPARRAALLVLAALAAALAPGAALAQGPPGPPGPPPGSGADLPAPPGTQPVFVPPGTAAAVPPGAGPGLLSGNAVRFNRAKRTFSLRLACQGKGTVRVTARSVARGTLASGRYRCAGSRGTATLKVSRKLAGRLVRRPTAAATAFVRQGGRSAKLYFQLRAAGGSGGRQGFWTDGHLQCSTGGLQNAYLAEPDFTARTPIPISTRGWVAWYTARTGWHWLGVRGENASRWETWTATPRGVAQFHPNGTTTPIPWTWGPISVPSGNGVYAIGVYEIVYWGGGTPHYRWQYVNAGTTGAAAAGRGTLYCVYP